MGDVLTSPFVPRGRKGAVTGAGSGDSGAHGVSGAALPVPTRSRAKARSARGVCGNAIARGRAPTPLNGAVFRDPARTGVMARRTTAGRDGVPADFTGIDVHLAGDASAYVTGPTLFVDGGLPTT